jgi:hypothetical protein
MVSGGRRLPKITRGNTGEGLEICTGYLVVNLKVLTPPTLLRVPAALSSQRGNRSHKRVIAMHHLHFNYETH